MRNILAILFLFIGFSLQAQVWKGAGLLYTSSAPEFTAPGKGAWVAVDTSSGDWYEWDKAIDDWVVMGERLQFTGTTGAPNYTPDQQMSGFAINTGDSLYAYQGGTWDCINCTSVDLTGYVTGSGTTGYVPYFTGAGAIGNSGAYWDSVNGRLGVNRVPTTYALEAQGKIVSYGASGASGIQIERFVGTAFHIIRDDGSNNLGIYSGGSGRVFLAPAAIQTLTAFYNGSAGLIGIGQTTPTARLHVTGSGSTSATTALLVENSGGTDGFEVKDDGAVYAYNQLFVTGNLNFLSNIRDNRANSLIIQSASGVATNRDLTVGNATYGRNMWSFKNNSFTTGTHPSLGLYTFYVNGETSTGATAADTYFKPQSANASTNARGGDFIVDLSSGDGTGRGGRFEINSTKGGFLPPRMTTSQRNAITAPADGLIIFCTDCTATDGSTGVSQTYSSSSWRNHY